MARKQSEYLAELLAEDNVREAQSSSQADHPPALSPKAPRARGTTLLGRESALARVASGEVRQVTQMLLDPARCRIWAGNARNYDNLSEDRCRELIDSIIAEGGQKVPAVVRRIEGDQDHDFEVIAGTRRHWSISWLRAHSYPDMQFLALVSQIDDEAAFRLADLENRAREDVSDLERARNYAQALQDHYGGQQTRMAQRLKLSKGWLSKMLKVARIPDQIVAAFSTPNDISLRGTYPLAQALSEPSRANDIANEADKISQLQKERREAGQPPLAAPAVISSLLSAGRQTEPAKPIVVNGAHDRAAVTIKKSNRQGVTLQLHAGHGLSDEELLSKVSAALTELKQRGGELQR